MRFVNTMKFLSVAPLATGCKESCIYRKQTESKVDKQRFVCRVTAKDVSERIQWR